jgi:septal ring factor EnvC (AmiA/AmiB activator)
MARKTIKQLEIELTGARELASNNYDRGQQWRTKAEQAEAALKESRSHFADLKERLQTAETELARLRGYMDRVHEDDIVRDGMIEIEDENGKRLVPKRPPQMRSVSNSGMDAFINHSSTSRKRTHWTSY